MGHKRIVVEVAQQIAGSPRAEHLARDQSPDVLSPTVGEIPIVVDTLPQGEIWAVDEPDLDNVLSVRINCFPESAVGAV